jgi:hypothetical protein
MGCDIHLHTEIKVNGVWHHYSQPRINRSYALFSKLAGVRAVEDVTPIVEPRGLPPDLSFTTQLDYAYAEQCYPPHDESWLTGEELEDVLNWLTARKEEERKRLGAAGQEVEWFDAHHHMFGYLFGNGWKLYPDERGSAYPAEIEDVRAVFWFDN